MSDLFPVRLLVVVDDDGDDERASEAVLGRDDARKVMAANSSVVVE